MRTALLLPASPRPGAQAERVSPDAPQSALRKSVSLSSVEDDAFVLSSSSVSSSPRASFSSILKAPRTSSLVSSPVPPDAVARHLSPSPQPQRKVHHKIDKAFVEIALVMLPEECSAHTPIGRDFLSRVDAFGEASLALDHALLLLGMCFQVFPESSSTTRDFAWVFASHNGLERALLKLLGDVVESSRGRLEVRDGRLVLG